ncbi:hypothetical protein HDV00_007979 [Rhizophlyctis rosea]|nr:hypothetical protein HDV00_007979 [Rhizophlyctis rosea]
MKDPYGLATAIIETPTRSATPEPRAAQGLREYAALRLCEFARSDEYHDYHDMLDRLFLELEEDGQFMTVADLEPMTDWGDMRDFAVLSHVWGHGGKLVCGGSCCGDEDGNEEDSGTWPGASHDLPIGQHHLWKIKLVNQLIPGKKIWADFVHVNQADPQIKGVQVGQMAQVYYHASQCVIVAPKLSEEKATQLEFIFKRLRAAGMDGCNDNTLNDFKVLLSIYEDGWLNRAWTSQESGLSQTLSAASPINDENTPHFIPNLLSTLITLFAFLRKAEDVAATLHPFGLDLHVIGYMLYRFRNTFTQTRIAGGGYLKADGLSGIMYRRNAYYTQDLIYAAGSLLRLTFQADYTSVLPASTLLLSWLAQYPEDHNKLWPYGFQFRTVPTPSEPGTSALPLIGLELPTTSNDDPIAVVKSITLAGIHITSDMYIGTIERDLVSNMASESPFHTKIQYTENNTVSTIGADDNLWKSLEMSHSDPEPVIPGIPNYEASNAGLLCRRIKDDAKSVLESIQTPTSVLVCFHTMDLAEQVAGCVIVLNIELGREGGRVRLVRIAETRVGFSIRTRWIVGEEVESGGDEEAIDGERRFRLVGNLWSYTSRHVQVEKVDCLLV